MCVCGGGGVGGEGEWTADQVCEWGGRSGVDGRPRLI